MKKLIRDAYECIECMSTVGKSCKKGKKTYCVTVNPDGNRQGIIYFKYCNGENYKSSDSVIRIRLDACEYVIHRDNKKIWHLNNDDKKRLNDFMSDDSKVFRGYTNYQVACYYWNYEVDLFSEYADYPDEYDSLFKAYISGWFDDKTCSEHPSYISSTCEKPDYSALPAIKI